MYSSDKIYAEKADAKDVLAEFQQEFHKPKNSSGETYLYLCGNSLGLQPKQTEAYIKQELQDWANLGVEGHFHAKNPWKPYHESLAIPMAKIVGAKPSEVVIMNSLTVNLHLMMVSFYQPTSSRYKIVVESDAFPSDRYAVASQIKMHGYHPDEAIIWWKPREGEELCRIEDLEKIMIEHGESIALLMIGNTNYYTGQLYPIERITKLGHRYGAKVGFDLAHGAGNIYPDLHESGPDFAVWCTYKYLNSGPGSLGGCFVHERHAKSPELPRMSGWWGHDKTTRFNMRHDFSPIPGAEGWQLSNPVILSMAAVKSSLDVFERADFKRIREKSVHITGYLEYLLKEMNSKSLRIITPENQEERGTQLSIQIKDADNQMAKILLDNGIIADWREPDVIRLAPVPLYNSYKEVYELVEKLKTIVKK